VTISRVTISRVSTTNDSVGRPDDAVVTLVIAGFDVAPYAREALESVRGQTFPGWHAILIDDHSTDGTREIFADAAASDDRFVFVPQPERRGLGAARNAALDRVRTPFVGFLDADDVLVPGALERLVGTLERTGSDFVVGAYARLRPRSGVEHDADMSTAAISRTAYEVGTVQPWVAAATDPERTATTIEEHPEASGNIVAWSKVSRTDFWVRSGLRFPEGRLYEDQVLAQAMYARARAFDVIPDVVVHWRVRPDGSSITQREAELPVLRDALDAMSAGLGVLREASATRAVQARAALILAMDVPRLASIAREHPDDAYRRALGAFVRDVWDVADESTRGGVDRDVAVTIDAASLW
jgi:CDP-glycerol glycerophosphotransferase